MAGFGFALLALPAMMAVLGGPAAVPLVIALSLANCIDLSLRVRRHARLRLVALLLAGSLLGLPLGVLISDRVGPTALLTAVGLVVLLFTLYLAIVRPTSPGHAASASGESGGETVPGAALALGCGAIAGAMTVSIGIPGPPIVLYLTAIGLPKDALRATTLTLFVGVFAVSLAAQGVVSGVPPTVWGSALALVPIVVVGGWLGQRVADRVDEAAFRRLVLALIVATVVASLFAGLRG